MATKDSFLTEITNDRNSNNNDNRYQNLNLNTNHKHSEANFAIVKSISDVKTKASEKDDNSYDNSRGFWYSNGSTWNSDERQSLKIIKTAQSHISECRKSKVIEECSSCDNHSTLSLHIAKYEAAAELMTNNSKNISNNTGQVKSRLKLKIEIKAEKLKTEMQKTFEFPRQQDNKISEPEISQFSASQKLLNPNNPNNNDNESAAKKPRLIENLEGPSSSFSTPLQTSPHSFPSTLPSFKTQKSTITILSPPVTTKPKFAAPTKPIVKEPMEWENYIDPDPEINQFAELQRLKEAGITIPEPPKPEKTEEEILKEKLQESEKERERLEAENTKVKEELQKARHYIHNKKYKEKKKAQTKEEKRNNDENEERDFEDVPTSTRYHIVNEIWNQLQNKYSPNMAAQIITTVYNQKVHVEKNSLTPSETLQVLKDSGISIGALRKIRSNLKKFNAPNPFASDRALNKERAQIHETVKFKKETVMMSNTASGPKNETDVYFRESVMDELQDRLNGIIEADNYEPFYVEGEEVIAAVLTNDKATEYSKLCMSVGNSKTPINSAHALSLLGHFKANDSQENMYEAYDRENGIGPQIDNIKEITVVINGEPKTLKVKWFVVGDFKFLNAIAGLNSNSCSFPCWNCEQKPETTYGELNMDFNAPKREMGINVNKSQIRDPLFKSIPFEYYIPPILHITLGPGAQLFEALCERARELDNVGMQSKDVPEELTDEKSRKKWEVAQEKIQKIKETLENLNNQKTIFTEDNEEPAIQCHSSKCIAATEGGKNVNKIYEMNNYCYQCGAYFHKCCLYQGQCPNCIKSPTPKQCKAVIDQDLKDIEKEIKQTSKLLKEEEDKIADIVSKFKLGSLGKNVEKILEKYGGSRKVFFQSFTGKQLTKMGSNIRSIHFDLDEKLQDDPEIQKITRAIVKFFDITKLLTTEILSDEDIDVIETKIKDFGSYMKSNLPHFRVKVKGHTFFKHLVKFMRKFKIAGYFSDEAIEAFHVIFNRYDRRIGNRSPDNYAQLMFYYNKEDTYIHDRFGYAEDDE